MKDGIIEMGIEGETGAEVGQCEIVSGGLVAQVFVVKTGSKLVPTIRHPTLHTKV
jgi:hypothetical protein